MRRRVGAGPDSRPADDLRAGPRSDHDATAIGELVSVHPGRTGAGRPHHHRDRIRCVARSTATRPGPLTTQWLTVGHQPPICNMAQLAVGNRSQEAGAAYGESRIAEAIKPAHGLSRRHPYGAREQQRHARPPTSRAGAPVIAARFDDAALLVVTGELTSSAAQGEQFAVARMGLLRRPRRCGTTERSRWDQHAPIDLPDSGRLRNDGQNSHSPVCYRRVRGAGLCGYLRTVR